MDTLEREFSALTNRIALRDAVCDLLRTTGDLLYALAARLDDRPEH